MKKTLLAIAAISALAVAAPAFAAQGNAAPAVAASRMAAPSSSAQSRAPVRLSLLARAQTKLKTDSLYNGPINGRRDRATIAAIRSYQTQNHLTVNGLLDSRTRRALGV